MDVERRCVTLQEVFLKDLLCCKVEIDVTTLFYENYDDVFIIHALRRGLNKTGLDVLAN